MFTIKTLNNLSIFDNNPEQNLLDLATNGYLHFVFKEDYKKPISYILSIINKIESNSINNFALINEVLIFVNNKIKLFNVKLNTYKDVLMSSIELYKYVKIILIDISFYKCCFSYYISINKCLYLNFNCRFSYINKNNSINAFLNKNDFKDNNLIYNSIIYRDKEESIIDIGKYIFEYSELNIESNTKIMDNPFNTEIITTDINELTSTKEINSNLKYKYNDNNSFIILNNKIINFNIYSFPIVNKKFKIDIINHLKIDIKNINLDNNNNIEKSVQNSLKQYILKPDNTIELYLEIKYDFPKVYINSFKNFSMYMQYKEIKLYNNILASNLKKQILKNKLTDEDDISNLLVRYT